jgi:endo-beta-N-acetylglucosaminidase D
MDPKFHCTETFRKDGKLNGVFQPPRGWELTQKSFQKDYQGETTMKKNVIKKAMCVLASVSVLSTVMFTDKPVHANLGYWPEPLPISNEYYHENETLQPYGADFQIDELKNWTPDNDPDARYNRSSVPLQKRWMGPSVNPNASRDATVIPLGGTSARASQGPSQGGDGSYAYTFTHFQYVDNYNYWGGSSAEGPIAIPTPEHIDSSHRNGVKATGSIHIPWGDTAFGSKFIDQLVEQDANGNFIAADKLIEIAQYYGFDGYVINQESSSSVESMAKFKDMLAYIEKKKPQNFTMTWYNGKGSIGDSDVKTWLQDGEKRINNDWWLDMSWHDIDDSIKSTINAGRSPFDIHATWENFPYTDKGADVFFATGADNKLKVSLGILGPGSTLISSKSIDDFMNKEDPRLWTGPTSDPRTLRAKGAFPGFSSLIADQTPIIGDEFETNFTVGNGKKFYEDGIVTGKENGWFNRSLTDIMPTWRWIVDSEGSKLTPKFDYEDAWWGGTSLKLSGNIDANKANHIKLYSSQLEIKDNSKISITYKTPKAGVDLSVGLSFGDTYDDNNFEFFNVPAGIEKNGWTTSTINLSKHDKKAIAISLKLNSTTDVRDYSINIGRLAFTTNEVAPAATSAITLDESLYVNDTTAEARIYWEKSANASLYTIHRLHADGKKEFIGATPSDAFYLGRFLKDGEEKQTSFEITSYNANGTVGGVKTFKFNWSAVTNGFEDPGVEGENIALNVPAVDDGSFDPGGKIDKINDGVIPSSKWSSTKTDASAYLDLGKDMDISRWVVKHANVSGAGEGVDFNTDTFDLQYATDDGQPILNPEDSASSIRIMHLNYTKVDEVVGNRQDITDRVLDTPIKARYIKLHVTKSDNCPWHAIRIYEFELYENGYTPHAVPLLDRNVTVKNNVGAKDSVVFNNVAMPIAGGGKLAENTGLVKIYDSLTAATPIAQVKAIQPDERYKQLHRGIASFENLELKAEGGRLYYTTQENEMVSLRYSVEYAPETGTEIKAPTSMKLEHSLKGNQTRSKYGVLTLEGLDVGTYMKIYESADSNSPILHSRPVQEGEDFIRQERIPLAKDGGTIYYELKQSGKPDSGRLEYSYGAADELNVDQTSLKDLVNRYSNLNEIDYISTTWEPFSKALNDVKALISTEVKASDAEVKRVALEESALSLRSIENIQRLKEVINEYETKYTQDRYSVNSFTRFSNVLEQTKKVVSDAESATKIFTNIELEKSRFDLDYAASHLVEIGDQKVDSVSIIPNDVDGKIGTSLTLKAEVAGNADDTVTWAVYGNTSPNTTISDGVLNIAADEKVDGVLTVKATSTIDATKSGTAQVLVVSELQPKIVSVTIPDQVDLVKSGTIKQFSSNVVVKNDASTAVTWTVYGAENAGTVINNGLLMVHEKETAEQVIIKATSVVDPTKFATKTIKVVKGFTVTIDSNIVNGTVKSESSSYTAGETVNLTVTPAEGYSLGSLKYNDGTSDVRIPEEFEMPANNITVTATFGKSHKITIDPNIKNGSIETPLGTEFTPGKPFYVVFMPSDGYQVKEGTRKYSYDGKDVSLEEAVAAHPEYAPYVIIFDAPDSDITFTAEFELIPVAETTHAVTIGTIDNGIVTGDKSTAKEGDTVTLTVTPNEGYQLKTGSLRLNGDVIIGNTFIMPAQIATITAEFELIPVKALVSLTTPTAITGLPNGTAKTADALELPATVEIVTDSGNMNADVEWDVASASYDPAVKTEQTFTVNGTVILPEGVLNTKSIPLTTSIEVTVAAATPVTPVTPPSGSGSGTGTTEPETTVSGGQVTTTTSVKAAIGSNGTAVTTIPETQITGAITKAVTEAAKQGANTAIAIKLDVTAPADAKAVEVALSSESLTKFIDSKVDVLIISTPIGTMTFDEKTASSISRQATGTITITVAKVETSTLPAEVQQTIGDRPVVSFDINNGDKTISQFGGNVTVTIPYTLKAGENPNAIVVYYISTAGKLEKVRNCKYDPATKTITYKTPHFSKYAVGYNKVDFKDVAGSAWYNDAVTFAAARGITSGVGNGNFGSENKVTRAQCLVMIMKAFGINPDETAQNNFNDAGNTYYTGYLAAAKRLGITSGVGNNVFAPEKEVTRQEMFVLTYNTLKSINELPTGTIAKELKDFKDAGTVSAYANDAMTLFVKTGVISGSYGNLLPADKATRAEFVQILYYIMIK